MPRVLRWTHKIDNAEFDQALPTKMRANRAAHGPICAPVLIEQVRVIGNLLCSTAEVWRDRSDTSRLAKSNLRDRARNLNAASLCHRYREYQTESACCGLEYHAEYQKPRNEVVKGRMTRDELRRNNRLWIRRLIIVDQAAQRFV